jgi:hypothetical protein
MARGLTIVASKQDGLGEPVKVSHLLGKDVYDVLLSTAQPILNYGFRYLQNSALLVICNNFNAKNAKDIQQECLLVPFKAFIMNAYVQPFQKFFMTKLVD